MLLAGLTIVSKSATAVTPADIEAARKQSETLQRQEQSQLQHDIEKSLPPEQPPQGIDTRKITPRPDASAAGSKCHNIHEIVISGAPHLPKSVRADINRRFLGRCLGVSEIEEILGEITKAYVQRGFIAARAYLPSQDLTTGRLEIIVIEGTVSEFRIDDGGKGSVSVPNAFTGLKGHRLNLRDLEQGIDQINRLSSNKAVLDIQPGEKPGESVIVVHNKPRSSLHFNLGYDNFGSPSTGRYQMGGTASIDNPLGFDDFITATHRETIPHHDNGYSSSNSLLYNIPFGYTTATFGWNRSSYATPIALPSGLELVMSGDTTTFFSTVDRVVYRDQANKVTAGATLSTKRSNNFLNDQYLDVSSRRLTILDVDGSATTLLGGGVFQVNGGISQGLNTLDALNDESDLPESAPRAQFRKYRLGANYFIPFKLLRHNTSFSSQISGQYSEDVLYGSEQMLIGSLYTVRGFLRNTLSGDHGFYWRNELSMQFPFRLGNVAVAGRAFVAYDLGEVWNRAPGVPSGSLSGGAFGVSVLTKGVSLDLFCTKPISGPSGMELEDMQTWFRLSCTI
jgi:hemolysin activation/secretion protein